MSGGRSLSCVVMLVVNAAAAAADIVAFLVLVCLLFIFSCGFSRRGCLSSLSLFLPTSYTSKQRLLLDTKAFSINS